MLKDEIEHSGGARALMAAMQYDLRGDEGGEAEEGEGRNRVRRAPYRRETLAKGRL